MRALVIGASGQVGGALVKALAARAHVVTATRATAPVAGAVPLDLRDREAVERLIRDATPDWIFCPGGLTHVDRCEDHPDEAFEINVTGPLVAARAGAGLGAGFVYYSSDYVFDGEHGPYSEEDLPRPLSAYGKTKLEAERMILQEIPRALVIRTAVVYGPERQEKNFVYQLLRRSRAGETTRAPMDQLSSPTHNDDLAAASVGLVERGALGLFHVAGPEVLSRYAFTRLACQVFGVNPSRVEPVTSASLNQRAPRPLRGGLRIDKVLSIVRIPLRAAEAGLRAMRQALEHAISEIS
jgi:dTDP-4-dehydrorhamnose reductase